MNGEGERPEVRARVVDVLLAVAAVVGIGSGPLCALWALLDSPCGPDSTVDDCVLAAPHATAVLFPLIAGPAAAIAALVLGVILRRRPRARRRAYAAAALVVAATLLVPPAIIALAPASYPSDYVPR